MAAERAEGSTTTHRWSELRYPGFTLERAAQQRRKLMAWRSGAMALSVRAPTGKLVEPEEIDWEGFAPPTGRPPAGPVSRDIPVLMRVSAEERDQLQRAARAAGLPLSTWMRGVALAACPPMAACPPVKPSVDSGR